MLYQFYSIVTLTVSEVRDGVTLVTLRHDILNAVDDDVIHVTLHCEQIVVRYDICSALSI